MHKNEAVNEYRDEAEVMGQDYSMDRLSAAFETSARRWELIVYPTLFAFIVLAAYGFYLVYSLARDVHYLAISVDSNMTLLANNMQSVSDNMNNLSANVHTITVQMDSIKDNVQTLKPMLTNMNSMDRSMQHMTHSTGLMRSDMAHMNRNISRPMSFMNNFLPW